MKLSHWVTVVIAGVLTIAPQVLLSVPPAYKDIASGVIATLGAIYHLYTNPPA